MPDVVNVNFWLIELWRHDVVGFREILIEGRFGKTNDRAAHPHLCVAPVILVLCMTEPMICDACAAGETDVTIDHQNLAVGPVVHFFEVVPLDRIEAADMAAC